MMLLALTILGLALLSVPIAGPALGLHLPASSSILLTAFGAGLLTLAGTLLVLTRLYQKTKASEAFVRTGAGGVP